MTSSSLRIRRSKAKYISLVAVSVAILIGRPGVAGAFNETFSGTGEFTSTGYAVSGFELPGWRAAGTVAPFFSDSALNLDCIASGPDLLATINLRRAVEFTGGFIERVELRSVDLGDANGNAHGIGDLVFERGFGGASSTAYIGLFEVDETADNEWNVAVEIGGSRFVTGRVKQGSDIAFEVRVLPSDGGSTVEVRYYSDLLDSSTRTSFGPFTYSGELPPSQQSYLSIGVTEMLRVTALVDNWSVYRYSGVLGDFDGDGDLTSEDLDQLTYDISSVRHVFLFDVNEDNRINSQDLEYWVHDLKKTYYGDANLDGQFNSADLVNIFAEGKYEDGISTNARWESGDWNADLEFDTSDLVVAFQDGGYERGPMQAAAVPEVVSLPLIIPSSLWCLRRRERSL